jgi:hypothetical protein
MIQNNNLQQRRTIHKRFKELYDFQFTIFL